jgi:hypothetical protein
VGSWLYLYLVGFGMGPDLLAEIHPLGVELALPHPVCLVFLFSI